jgi:hypothetical protein
LVRWVSSVVGGVESGRAAYSFFLKAVFLDDPLDAACADRHVALADLLGDHLGGGVGVEEAVSDHLSDDFLGTSIVGSGPPLFVSETGAPLFVEPAQQLEVTLLGVAVLAGGLGGPEALTLALEKHGQFQDDFVVGSDR